MRLLKEAYQFHPRLGLNQSMRSTHTKKHNEQILQDLQDESDFHNV